MNINKIKMIYTIFVFVLLGAFDNMIIGLFPPLFSSIAKDLSVHVSTLGIVSAINILVTSISSIYWGYLAGKFNRKILIIIGTAFWSASVFLTSRSNTYMQLLSCQIFIGIGLGCILSIGFSVLTDYIPYKFRGMLLSLWGMSQGFGGIAGSIMASLIAPATSWRKPFEIVSIIGGLLIVLYIFITEPILGESELELKELIKDGYKYNYQIEVKQLYNIILKRSNILLFLQAFFINITTGTLIWLPTLYISKIQGQGYSLKTSIVASGYLFAIFQLGGVTSAFFGYLGDIAQRKTYKGRAMLTSIFIFSMIPLYVTMFQTPMNNLSLTNNNNPVLILLDLLKQIIINPWMTSIFILSFLASAVQSANTPNWLALITDVNLPEHRGTAFSIGNLTSGVGRTIGNTGIGILISFVSIHTAEPQNYIIALMLFQVFLIPASFCYLKMAENNAKDIREVKLILNKRRNNR